MTGMTEHEQAHRARRAVLKTGAILIPTIMTLHASPAWAATDYTVTAYRYGANAGLCRNPDFDGRPGRADRGRDPHSERSRASWKQEEFVPCDQAGSVGGDIFGGTTTTQAADETIIEF